MTDPDDDALTWDGDEELRRPARPAPRLVAEADDPAAGDTHGGAFGLVALGLFAGLAALEVLGWVRGVTSAAMMSSLDDRATTPLEVVSLVGSIVGRVAAVAAPAVWFGVVVWRIRRPQTRLVWLLLGALLLLPWPFLLGLR